jgi:hypothetical protein
MVHGGHRRSPDVFPFDRSPGPAPLGAFIGGVHSAHQVGLAAFVRMVDQCQPSHCLPERRRVCVWRNAEGFVPGELDFLEQDLDGFGRGMLQNRGESDRPERCCGATAGPVVDLARRVSGDACEGGLADVGAGEQCGELGV